MDAYRSMERIGGYTPMRIDQEKDKIYTKPVEYTLPYRATYTKNLGEFGPSMKDKIEVNNFLEIIIFYLFKIVEKKYLFRCRCRS